jgi:hypothetical protein
MDEEKLTGDEFAWYAFTRTMMIVCAFIAVVFVFIIL